MKEQKRKDQIRQTETNEKKRKREKDITTKMEEKNKKKVGY